MKVALPLALERWLQRFCLGAIRWIVDEWPFARKSLDNVMVPNTTLGQAGLSGQYPNLTDICAIRAIEKFVFEIDPQLDLQ